MTCLDVVMGGITYRTSDLLSPADHQALATAVHRAMLGLGLEPHVRAPGFERDGWGALRPQPNLARQTTERAS